MTIRLRARTFGFGALFSLGVAYGAWFDSDPLAAIITAAILALAAAVLDIREWNRKAAG